MKKILIALIAVLSVVSASAQFQVQQKQSKPEVVWQEFFGWATLYKQNIGNGDYYYFIACRSSNQFDDIMLIHLGKKDKAAKTLTQFYDLYSKGEIYELVDDKGEKFSAECASLNGYRIFKKGYAGYGTMMLKYIRNMQSAINEE